MALILFGCAKHLREHSNFGRILKLLLLFSADIEEWRCSGAVAHRLTLLLQRVYHWASAGAQHIEHSVLRGSMALPI